MCLQLYFDQAICAYAASCLQVQLDSDSKGGTAPRPPAGRNHGMW